MFREFVYVIKAGRFYKIGRTSSLEKRTMALDLQLPFKAALFKVFNVPNSKAFEFALHRHYASSRVNGEWFALNDIDAVKLWMMPSAYYDEDHEPPYDIVEMIENGRRLELMMQGADDAQP